MRRARPPIRQCRRGPQQCTESPLADDSSGPIASCFPHHPQLSEFDLYRKNALPSAVDSLGMLCIITMKHRLAKQSRVSKRLGVMILAMAFFRRRLFRRRHIRYVLNAVVVLFAAGIVYLTWVLTQAWDQAGRIGLTVGVMGSAIGLLPSILALVRQLTWLPEEEIQVSPKRLQFTRPVFGDQAATESHTVTIRNRGSRTVHQVRVRLSTVDDVGELIVHVRPNSVMECMLSNRTDVNAVFCRDASRATLWIVIRRMAPEDRYDFMLNSDTAARVDMRLKVEHASTIPAPQLQIVDGNSAQMLFGPMPAVFGNITMIWFPCELDNGDIVPTFPRPIPRARA